MGKATNQRWIVLGALCKILLGCGTDASGGKDSSQVSTVSADSVASLTLSWRLEAPAAWDAHVKIVDAPESVARLTAEGVRSARLFNYIPFDSSVVAQTLLGVYVYDSTAWAKLEREGGPPRGEVVTRGAGVAYVASLPQSNPFAPGSRDSVEFSRRTVTMDFVKKAFRVVP